MMTASFFLSLALNLPLTLSNYRAEAFNKKGELVYTEEHQVKMTRESKISKATTVYRNAQGEVIAKLESDFSKSLTAPEHVYTDLRDQSTQGVRLDENAFILYRSIKDKPEQTKSFARDKWTDGLVVGCQGLHYYLLENLSQLREQLPLRVKLLIPGRLDYYSFLLSFDGETPEGWIKLKLRVENWFLRLFAPSFSMVYDPQSGRLLSYQGVTHIKDQEGRLQDVRIKYFY